MFFQSLVWGEGIEGYQQSELLAFLLLCKCVHRVETRILVDV